MAFRAVWYGLGLGVTLDSERRFQSRPLPFSFLHSFEEEKINHLQRPIPQERSGFPNRFYKFFSLNKWLQNVKNFMFFL